jgi:hypothetical protein
MELNMALSHNSHPIFKLYDFTVTTPTVSTDDSSTESDNDNDTSISVSRSKCRYDNKVFKVQMFGINETGESASIEVNGFKPFFYLRVDNQWNQAKKQSFMSHVKQRIGKYYESSITECILIGRKKLYGFDGNTIHKFLKISFANTQTLNKMKTWWYRTTTDSHGERVQKLAPEGYIFGGTNIELYEAHIPPLLRCFHIKEISPSGWVQLPGVKKCYRVPKTEKKTTCTHEFIVEYKNITPLNSNECSVPYNIMSMDIEANSSHGDFPVPKKSYKKLATNIFDYFETHQVTPENLHTVICSAFGLRNPIIGIERVFPKGNQPTAEQIAQCCDLFINSTIHTTLHAIPSRIGCNRIDDLFAHSRDVCYRDDSSVYE